MEDNLTQEQILMFAGVKAQREYCDDLFGDLAKSLADLQEAILEHGALSEEVEAARNLHRIQDQKYREAQEALARLEQNLDEQYGHLLAQGLQESMERKEGR